MAEFTRKAEQVPTILLVDSGVGGLSVYRPLRQRLPGLHYIYAFDNGGFPYGNQPDARVIQRVTQLIESVQRHHAIQLIVLACNTASTLALPSLRQRFTCPIVGVVPAIKLAAKLTRSGIIGLLATPATIQRSYTNELIQQFAMRCQIKSLGTTELAQLAEAKLRGAVINPSAIKKIVSPWLSSYAPPDTVVLGCTHFSLLKSELLSALPDGIQLVDSIVAIIQRVENLLALSFPEQLGTTYRVAWEESKAIYPVYCTQQAQELDLVLTGEPWFLQPTQVIDIE